MDHWLIKYCKWFNSYIWNGSFLFPNTDILSYEKNKLLKKKFIDAANEDLGPSTHNCKCLFERRAWGCTKII